MLNGLIEPIHSNDKTFMDLDSIVCFESKAGLFGKKVLINESITQIRSGTIELVLDGVYESKKGITFGRAHLLGGNDHTSRADQDVYEDRSDEEDDDDNNNKEKPIPDYKI